MHAQVRSFRAKLSRGILRKNRTFRIRTLTEKAGANRCLPPRPHAHQVSANGTLMALVGLQRVALMRLPPPWQPPGAAADANDVAELFEGLGLGQYAAGARDLGYDLPTLRRLSGVEQTRMAEELRMKPGHSLKLTMCAPTPGPRRAAPPASAKAPPRATPPSCRAAPTAPPLTPLPPRAQGARRADAGARARARGAR